MFRKTLVKLTLLYLGVMMAISLFFSVALYRTSTAELDRDYANQVRFFANQPLPPNFNGIANQFLADRRAELRASKLRLVGQLAITNVTVLALGGLLSYLLARRTLRPIEEAHAAQSRFTADASHELRTPLAVMQTEIEVALMNSALTLNEAKGQLQSNLEELARLTSLSEGLLRLARLEDGKLEKQPVSVNHLIEQAMARVGGNARQRRIKLDIQKHRDRTVHADEPSIIEVLVILLENAIKYSPENSTVTISSGTSQKQIAIRIKDQGPGIAEPDIHHIFERFYRADASRTNGQAKGHGLGLAIAKNIVDLHGGSIEVISKVGSGSTFSVLLPD